jgi:predicted house-cleaning NTP pyrophosphatase (Maf/HAM1 superfamily)
MGLVGVQKIEGCYYNVMGFPMHRFIAEFSK